MININEIMKGSLLLHEGKVKRVRAIGDYIQFEGTKEWIGGSMITGEPISSVWLERLSFVWNSIDGVWTNGKISLFYKDNRLGYYGSDRLYDYVHQIQLLHFAITGEHLSTPKLPK